MPRREDDGGEADQQHHAGDPDSRRSEDQPAAPRAQRSGAAAAPSTGGVTARRRDQIVELLRLGGRLGFVGRRGFEESLLEVGPRRLGRSARPVGRAVLGLHLPKALVLRHADLRRPRGIGCLRACQTTTAMVFGRVSSSRPTRRDLRRHVRDRRRGRARLRGPRRTAVPRRARSRPSCARWSRRAAMPSRAAREVDLTVPGAAGAAVRPRWRRWAARWTSP